jgi:anti-sigma B factor antagonist
MTPLSLTSPAVSVARAEDVAIVSPAGELDLTTAPQLSRRLRALYDAGVREAIVDLSETSFLDVIALRSLIDAAGEAALWGARLYLLHVQGQPRELIEMAGLAEIVGLV